MAEAAEIEWRTSRAVALDRVVAKKVILCAIGLDDEHVFIVIVPPEPVSVGRRDKQLNVHFTWNVSR
ncbi:MAG: hypothetical protein WD688_04085 [Candidatus Binatia bacterium]